MLARLYQNHVLVNLTFLLVLVVGFLSYSLLPREQDPTINFNWIEVHTALPGAAASDVEQRITNVLEEAMSKVSDIKFVSSTSRDGLSAIVVRFSDIDSATFDKRVSDLRREVSNKSGELPEGAKEPMIIEVTTANSIPTATLVITAVADDENLRWQAEQVRKDVERIRGIDQVWETGLRSPELQVQFLPERLQQLDVSAVDLADTVSDFFHDQSAGSVQVAEQNWLVRVIGASSAPGYLARLPVMSSHGEVLLGEVAEVSRGRAEARQLVRYKGEPAVMLAVTKQAQVNTLQLVQRLNEYVAERNRVSDGTGVQVELIDDQTEMTRSALKIMENNALLGLFLVLLVSWIFLGSRIALITSIGIPFVLAGTFWLLSAMDQTLNVMVLLGVVISLGMLVDDAVVVVEAIYYRMQRGADALTASIESLKEIFAPVTAAVLTTIAAFLPLMLMPGILGKFMLVVPLVVTTALLISLLEAFWMLPAHVLASRISFDKPSPLHNWRVGMLHTLRVRYTLLLVKVMRYPKTVLAATLGLFVVAVTAASSGVVKVDFFASDPIRKFYINIIMPSDNPLKQTMEKGLEVEETVRAYLQDEDARAVVVYAGQMFTETGVFVGDRYAQILVSLNPRIGEMRSVDELMDSMRDEVVATVGAERILFQRLTGGPPAAKAVSVKVRGDEVGELRAAVAELKGVMTNSGVMKEITDDDSLGQMELRLKVNTDAAQRAGVSPVVITRMIGLMVDGEVVATMQDQGEELEIRVKAKPVALSAIDDLLRVPVPVKGGGEIALSRLVVSERGEGVGNIRHYDFRRAITVEADIDKAQTNTVAANKIIQEAWQQMAPRYPNVDLDFSGELDDIKESMDSLIVLFLFGLMLMYLILGTQFRSYVQPLVVLVTVPMAFTGVMFGLWITQNPLSLYTMYGVVALAGIAVNSAIVLISATNDRLRSGMSPLHATLYAARRRVIPIIITTATTVAGLFSLATGLGGHSLLWGAVATAIVWGLLLSAVLTLFVIPVLLRLYLGGVVAVSAWICSGGILRKKLL